MRKATTAKLASESLNATAQLWSDVEYTHYLDEFRKITLLLLPLPACFLISLSFSKPIGPLIPWYLLLLLVTIGLFYIKPKYKASYTKLKADREFWQSQLLLEEEWKKIVTNFGNLSSSTFKEMYNNRLEFLIGVLGKDFVENLP